jgi:hypothetical protein
VLDFAAALLDACAHSLPSAVVVRVGLASNADRGDEHWAVVEANMAWFSTRYAADPSPVLDVVVRSAGPRQRLTPGEQTFTRPPTPSGNGPRQPTWTRSGQGKRERRCLEARSSARSSAGTSRVVTLRNARPAAVADVSVASRRLR